MDAFLTSAGIVALAEIGDKTQLLAIVLAAKFKKPVPIILGILVATLLNHAAAAGAGFYVAAFLKGKLFQALVGAAFIVMALWALVPDKEDGEAVKKVKGGVFMATAVAFFFVEIGDKTQIATSLLAARFHNIALVAAGTTLGMMIANIPAVYFGEAATKIVPLKYVRLAAAAVFLVIGLWVIVNAMGA
ncbi:MAG: hypothetical protein A3E78_10240 [Alphaproteobacteria bacterium RIFCSPHIGHO2_12_FULL_63_12]|nr:MAG: hypothetical protein A3E78_10240 [Alphaproteobacteria bacterium RIFCSPHIGHO2_12_FULL_63_12]